VNKHIIKLPANQRDEQSNTASIMQNLAISILDSASDPLHYRSPTSSTA